jgi:hypothetical protein
MSSSKRKVTRSEEKSKPQRVRRPKFDSTQPQSFSDLSELWRHRENLRKNLLRAKQRCEVAEFAERAEKDVVRIERNLLQLDENHKAYYDHVKLLMDLTLVKGRLQQDSEDFKRLDSVTDSIYAGLTGE